MIHASTGGDMVELEIVQPYPSDYKATTDQAKKELRDNVFPALKGKATDVRLYDVILVGSPNW